MTKTSLKTRRKRRRIRAKRLRHLRATKRAWKLH